MIFGTLENVVHDSASGNGTLLAFESVVRNVTNNGGTLALENATLDGHIVNAAIISTHDQVVVGSGSRLTMRDGNISGGSLQVNSGGKLDGGGTIEGDVSIAIDGIIGNDLMATQMDVFGNLNLEGLMQMELAGTNDLLGQYDQYNVYDNPLTQESEGMAFLNGILELSSISSFMPVAGQTNKHF